MGHGSLAHVGAGYVHATDVVQWAGNDRVLEALRPPVRLLPSHWYYDAATKTLFTGDLFNHVWRDDAHGPWIVDPAEQPPTFSRVYDFLTGTRYWWLPGAFTDELLADLRRVFEEHVVEVIAPRFGCVIAGPESVRPHYELFEAVLRESAMAEPAGVTAGVEPMGGRACERLAAQPRR